MQGRHQVLGHGRDSNVAHMEWDGSLLVVKRLVPKAYIVIFLLLFFHCRIFQNGNALLSWNLADAHVHQHSFVSREQKTDPVRRPGPFLTDATRDCRPVLSSLDGGLRVSDGSQADDVRLGAVLKRSCGRQGHRDAFAGRRLPLTAERPRRTQRFVKLIAGPMLLWRDTNLGSFGGKDAGETVGVVFDLPRRVRVRSDFSIYKAAGGDCIILNLSAG
jgi:hypothetical protein